MPANPAAQMNFRPAGTSCSHIVPEQAAWQQGRQRQLQQGVHSAQAAERAQREAAQVQQEGVLPAQASGQAQLRMPQAGLPERLPASYATRRL